MSALGSALCVRSDLVSFPQASQSQVRYNLSASLNSPGTSRQKTLPKISTKLALINVKTDCKRQKAVMSLKDPETIGHVGEALLPTFRRPSAPGLRPSVVHYSKNRDFINSKNLTALWEKAGIEYDTDPQKVKRTIENSFSIIVAVAFEKAGEGRVVGCARAMSDGAFVATICDVAVEPEFQGRGIGRSLLRHLVEDMRSKGPGNFAAFPKPSQRDFFYKCGFRISHKFVMMKYMGREEDYQQEHPNYIIKPTIDNVLGTDKEKVVSEDVEEEVGQQPGGIRPSVGSILLSKDGEMLLPETDLSNVDLDFVKLLP